LWGWRDKLDFCLQLAHDVAAAQTSNVLRYLDLSCLHQIGGQLLAKIKNVGL